MRRYRSRLSDLLRKPHVAIHWKMVVVVAVVVAMAVAVAALPPMVEDPDPPMVAEAVTETPRADGT